LLRKEERIGFLKFQRTETGTQKRFQFERQKINENTQKVKNKWRRKKVLIDRKSWVLDNINSSLQIFPASLIGTTCVEFVNESYVESIHTKSSCPLHPPIRVIYNPSCLASS